MAFCFGFEGMERRGRGGDGLLLMFLVDNECIPYHTITKSDILYGCCLFVSFIVHFCYGG